MWLWVTMVDLLSGCCTNPSSHISWPWHIVGDAMKLECFHIELFLLCASTFLLHSALATVYLICLMCDACMCFFWKFLGHILGACYGGKGKCRLYPSSPRSCRCVGVAWCKHAKSQAKTSSLWSACHPPLEKVHQMQGSHTVINVKQA